MKKIIEAWKCTHEFEGQILVWKNSDGTGNAWNSERPEPYFLDSTPFDEDPSEFLDEDAYIVVKIDPKEIPEMPPLS